MKKLFIITFLLFSTGIFNAHAQCTIKIKMYDSYGDGWDNSHVITYINGTLTNYYYISYGYYSEATLTLQNGQEMSVNYSPGDFPQETHFEIEKNGVTEFISAQPPVTGINFTTDCVPGVANDDAAHAIPITCDTVLTGSTTGAHRINDITVTCGTLLAPGVWYKINGTDGTMTASLCGSSYDTDIAIFSGQPDSLSCVSSNDNFCGNQSQVSWYGFTGVSYYIRINGNSYQTGSFTLTTTCASAPPPNDDCAGAKFININSNNVVTGSTTPATIGNDGAVACGTLTAAGVWYYVNGDGTQITASLCGSSYDTYLSVFNGNCSAMTCIGSNDNVCGLQSEFTWNSTTPASYYILVSGNYETGTYKLTLSHVSLVTNDECSGAIPVSCGSVINTTTLGATISNHPYSPYAPCDPYTDNDPDIWYSVAGTGTMMTANVGGTGKVSVYQGNCSSLSCVTFTDNYNGNSATATWYAAQGVAYFIRVPGLSTASINLSINCDPANDPCTQIINIPATCPGSSDTTVSLYGLGVFNTSLYSYTTTFGNEQIFSYTPTTSGTALLNIISPIDYPVSWMWKAASTGCIDSAWNLIQFVNDTGSFSFGPLTAGLTYYIMANAEDPQVSTNQTFNIECPVPKPVNDNCEDVTPVSLVSGIPQVFTGTTVGASKSAEEAHYLMTQCVWHAITLTECSTLTLSYCGTNPAFGDVMSALGKNCPLDGVIYGSKSQSDCEDGNWSVSFSVLPPGTYYIPVMGKKLGITEPGPYILTVTATSIASVYAGTLSIDKPSICQGEQVNLCLDSANGSLTMQLAYNQAGPFYSGSSVHNLCAQYNLNTGTYYFRAAAYNCYNTVYSNVVTLTVSAQNAFDHPCNNNCGSSNVLSCGVNGPYSCNGATVDALEPSPSDTNCYGPMSWCASWKFHTVWFQYTYPLSGGDGGLTMQIWTGGSSGLADLDSRLALWDPGADNVTCPTNFTGWSLVGANDDDSAYVAHNAYEYSSYIKIPPCSLIPGRTYWVQVDPYWEPNKQFKLVVGCSQTPIFNCGPDIIQSTDSAQCGAQITIPPPIIETACNFLYVLNSFNSTNDASGFYHTGKDTVIWSAVTMNGFSTTCKQIITVTDNEPPLSLNLEPLRAQCSLTATPPVTTDNCSGTVTATTNNPTVYTSQGAYTVIWAFTDGSGNSSTSNQTVFIEDVSVPEIGCINNQVIDLINGELAYTVNGTEFDPIETYDNCGIFSLTNSFNGLTTLAGTQLPLGLNTITWTITDLAGNDSTCTFDVLVNTLVSIDLLIKNGISIHPNPTSSKICIESSNTSIQNIRITDLTKNILFETSDFKQKAIFDLSDYSSGIYLISIQTTDRFYTYKLIKE